MAKTSPGPANPLADLKRALIGHMLDTKQSAIHVSPDSAGRVLLAPDDWDLEYSQDRDGIHVSLVDREASEPFEPEPVPAWIQEANRPTVLNGSDDSDWTVDDDRTT